jgi:hypothetical protein
MTVGELIALLSTVEPSRRVLIQAPVSGANDCIRVSVCEFRDRMNRDIETAGVVLESKIPKDEGPAFVGMDTVVH